jgi:hypothetical protein
MNMPGMRNIVGINHNENQSNNNTEADENEEQYFRIT